MILAHPQMDTVLDFSISKINTMVIENQDFFRTFLQDIRFQIDGFDGKTVLSEGNTLLEWPKKAEILDSFLSFQLNRKPLLTKITSAMESAAVSEGFYGRTVQLLSQIECYLDELAFAMDCDVSCGELTVSGLLKGAGVSLREDYKDPLERLLDDMELVRCYEREKLFIFVNLRSYFPDDSISRFLQTALDHQYWLLLVDACEYPKLPEEQRLIIDKDLCEI